MKFYYSSISFKNVRTINCHHFILRDPNLFIRILFARIQVYSWPSSDGQVLDTIRYIVLQCHKSKRSKRAWVCRLDKKANTEKSPADREK